MEEESKAATIVQGVWIASWENSGFKIEGNRNNRQKSKCISFSDVFTIQTLVSSGS